MQTVAELQAALQQSQANEARYRLLLEHSSEVGWTIDLASGRLSWLSPAAERQFGHTLDSAQALAAGLLHDLPARLERYANGDLSRRRVVRETELPDSAGRMVPVEITSTLLPDAAGRPATLLGFVRDLSAQRALAEQQKKFASMLSHEFRTPLSTIDGAVQRLEMTGAHHDEGTRKRYRKIQVAVDRMLAMLDEYLSPERMASIGRVRQPNEVSPARLLEGVAEQARSRRPQISVQTAGLPPWMRPGRHALVPGNRPGQRHQVHGRGYSARIDRQNGKGRRRRVPGARRRRRHCRRRLAAGVRQGLPRQERGRDTGIGIGAVHGPRHRGRARRHHLCPKSF